MWRHCESWRLQSRPRLKLRGSHKKKSSVESDLQKQPFSAIGELCRRALSHRVPSTVSKGSIWSLDMPPTLLEGK